MSTLRIATLGTGFMGRAHSNAWLQVGHFFPVGKQKGYVNLKAYWEFAAQNRAEGWNLWVSVALPLSMGSK